MMALMSMFVSSSKQASEAGDQASINSNDASNTQTNSSTGVQEDALLAVTALVEVLGEGFLKYIDGFMPVLFNCLRNCTETQVS